MIVLVSAVGKNGTIKPKDFNNALIKQVIFLCSNQELALAQNINTSYLIEVISYFMMLPSRFSSLDG